MQNISDKEIIRDFTELTTYLKSLEINPGFHFIDNEALTALKMARKTMEIKYHLVSPITHKESTVERNIQTLNKHFIVGICSADKYFHLQLWDRLIQ